MATYMTDACDQIVALSERQSVLMETCGSVGSPPDFCEYLFSPTIERLKHAAKTVLEIPVSTYCNLPGSCC
jgi:hypothetical protein